MGDAISPSGKAVVLHIWDGDDLVYVGPGEGHRLPVDVEATVLATDAATAANQVLIDERLDAIKVTRGSVALVSTTGVVASSATWTSVLDIAGKGVITSLDFSTDFVGSELRLTVDGDRYNLLSRTGNIGALPSPTRLNQVGGESAVWKNGVYDAENNYYSLYLKRELHYNDTLVLEVRQASGINKNIGCQMLYQGVS